MKTIAFDVDDVLNDLKSSWINAYNAIYHDNKTVEDIKGWDFENYVKPECGKKVYEILKTPKFFYNLNVKEYAIDVLRKLSNKYNIIIVTDISYAIENVMDKVEWLKKYFPFISEKQYYFCSDKTRIQADYIIDDGIHNLINFKGKRIKFEMPYNKEVEIPNCTTVKNFKDIEKYFLEELNK